MKKIISIFLFFSLLANSSLAFSSNFETKEITWSDLRKLNYKTGEMPASLRQLVGKSIKIPGFGESIQFGITTTQKTSVTLQVLDKNSNIIGENISCLPTANFKCEILWTFPKNIAPGEYIVSVNDSKITVEKRFEIE